MNVVGLCGVAGSGKDTVADFLVKNHGFVKVAFADPLKRICKDVFNFTDEQLWGPSAMRNAADERYPRAHSIYEEGMACGCCNVSYEEADNKACFLTPRLALQLLGSEWGRDCYQNVWVDYALRVADNLLHKSGILRSVHYSYNAKGGLAVTNVPVGPKPKGVVISDVRFRNEVDAVSAAGGKVVRIVRKNSGLVGASAKHQSETEQNAIPDSLFDYHLLNHSESLDVLEAAVGGLVETLGLV
jgi:hypothetical protein